MAEQRLQLVGPPDRAVASASTTLIRRPAPAPVVCHDVNGYYAALGVRPGASRRELADAYRARGGENDPYLTDVFKLLLSRTFRARYDALPPGHPYPDRHHVEELMRHASVKASSDNAEYGTTLTATDILKSLGLTPEKSPHDSFDSTLTNGFDESGTRDRQPSPTPETPWAYAYLLLGSTCENTSRLAQWQHGIGLALDRHHTRRQFVVGYHAANPEPFLLLEFGGTPVFLLNEDQDVTGELIAAAVTAATR